MTENEKGAVQDVEADARCTDTTGGGRYRCRLPLGHEGRHSDFPSTLTTWEGAQSPPLLPVARGEITDAQRLDFVEANRWMVSETPASPYPHDARWTVGCFARDLAWHGPNLRAAIDAAMLGQ